MDTLRGPRDLRNLKVGNREAFVNTSKKLKETYRINDPRTQAKGELLFTIPLDTFVNNKGGGGRERPGPYDDNGLLNTEYQYVEKKELPSYLLLLHTYKTDNFLGQMCKNIFSEHKAINQSYSGQVDVLYYSVITIFLETAFDHTS